MSGTIYREPSAEELEAFWQGLREHNARFISADFAAFKRVAVDAAGAVVGGINGMSYWRKLHIDNLWVDERCRGRGIGTALMGIAEDEARARGCAGIVLDTMSFQAIGFYHKLGYREFGRLDGYAQGATRHYFHKAIS